MSDRDEKQSRLKELRYAHIKMTRNVLGSIIAEFEDMEKFKEFMLSAIDKEKQSIQRFHKKETKGMSDDEASDYYEFFAEDFFLVDDFFTEVSLQSFIVMLYSYVESGLNSLCRVKYYDTVGQQKKDNKRARDEGRPEKPLLTEKYTDNKKDKGIERAKKYLKDTFCIDFRSVESEWVEIKAFAKIRNAIVHNNGYAGDNIITISERTKSLKIKDTAIKRNVKDGRIDVNQNEKIIIKPTYPDFILRNVISFFRNIEV
jgi:hypothetical protein